MAVTKPIDCDGFKIAIICALAREREAVTGMLDGCWDIKEYLLVSGDPNTYQLGHIGPHSVVIALLPGMGTEAATSTAASFRCSFRNINLCLVVGVCGGVPTTTDAGHILLGDVVLSEQIVRFAFGKQYDNGMRIENTTADGLGRSNKEIQALLETIQSKQARAQMKAKILTYLMDLRCKSGFESLKFPRVGQDIVFPRNYRHKHQQPGSCSTCAECKEAEDKLNEARAVRKLEDEIKALEDALRQSSVCASSQKLSCEDLKCDGSEAVLRELAGRDPESIEGIEIRVPEIHVGTMGCADSVMKSGYYRDELAKEQKIIAFEMEGAGVWDNLPTIVIKSVCDYADSHKSKDWQDYAAASAAACMKALLTEWTATDDMRAEKLGRED